MRVLVTGGSGYIGAHVIRMLAERGDSAVVADDFSAGVRDRVAGIPVIETDLSDPSCIAPVTAFVREQGVDAVIHFAARKRVAESVERAAWYYSQNLGSLANVMQVTQDAGIDRFIFSSSAAVYATSPTPVDEDAPTLPANPYGETKLAGEWLTASATRAFGLRAISLRYFNVTGAGSPELGDVHAQNLVPMVYEAIERGEAPLIFGDDYDTPDGTCIRDYIHVTDLSRAHLAALDALDGRAPSHEVYNVGTGTGSSVLDMVTRMIAITGAAVQPRVEPRRPGDPAVVVADPARIGRDLGWSAELGIDDMLRSAWDARP
ncbi:MAG TPA: UDP-glucose 4-epimerase GalE [Pseudolysinimonas sp.]|nr:UDP-glucose 4-epimerase GalE [Pseudolysinimonas sp.]